MLHDSHSNTLRRLKVKNTGEALRKIVGKNKNTLPIA